MFFASRNVYGNHSDLDPKLLLHSSTVAINSMVSVWVAELHVSVLTRLLPIRISVTDFYVGSTVSSGMLNDRVIF